MRRGTWRRIGTEPLLHFALAGAALFAVDAWRASDPAETVRPLVIGSGEVEWLADTWARQWHRPPSPRELRDLVSALLREQLLAREAEALGLAENDTVVRRRLAQKLEFMVRDTAQFVEPTEADLRRLYAEKSDAFTVEARFSLEQIFFSADRRRDPAAAARAARDALDELDRQGGSATELGDPLLVDADWTNVGERDLTALLGPGFVAALGPLEPGVWSGPIESGYGVHLVRVAAVEPARRRSFAEARAELQAEWRAARAAEAYSRYLAELAAKYGAAVETEVEPLIGGSIAPAEMTG